MKNWNKFPMGPASRKYLEIGDEDYQGEQSQDRSEETAALFQSDLLNFIPSKRPDNVLDHVDLLEEFTNMGMSQAAVKLYELPTFPNQLKTSVPC